MKPILMTYLFLGFSVSLFAQAEKCATQSWWEQNQSEQPNQAVMLRDIESATQAWIRHQESSVSERMPITIPVVVHVVWYWQDEVQNISDEQIFSQIEALNEDFRALNDNISTVPDEFKVDIADTEIEFCLATIDPEGNSTNGIVRMRTDFEKVGSKDDVLFSTFRTGSDIWNSEEYLNIYVVDLDESVNGKASFPGAQTPDKDAVVINYRYFGRMGTALNHQPYHMGKTTTHEVGHFLNLRHIWGNFGCAADDSVADTPAQENSYLGACPTHPQSSCGSNDMFMNYMDYTNDECLAMFTIGQKQRMLATLNTCRSGLKNANACGMVSPPPSDTSQIIQIFPNPASDYITIYFQTKIPEEINLYLYNAAGQLVHQGLGTCLSTYIIPTDDLATGLYFFKLERANTSIVRKVMVNR